MAIEVTCACGKKLSAKDELAGKRVKCPECGQPLAIPAESTSTQPAGAVKDDTCMAALLDEIGMEASRTGVRCPNCKSDLTPEAILCIKCGYNLETGKLIKTDSFVKQPKSSGIGAPNEKPTNGKSKFGFLSGLFGKK